MVVMGRFAYSATVDVSTILTSVGARVATLLASVFADTTGWYSSVHQPGSTAMVGGVDMATTLREKATNFLSSAVFLAKDKWDFSTPQRTRRRRGGLSTTRRKAGHYWMGREFNMVSLSISDGPPSSYIR